MEKKVQKEALVLEVEIVLEKEVEYAPPLRLVRKEIGVKLDQEVIRDNKEKKDLRGLKVL